MREYYFEYFGLASNEWVSCNYNRVGDGLKGQVNLSNES
jgi:hypothetical protein